MSGGGDFPEERKVGESDRRKREAEYAEGKKDQPRKEKISLLFFLPTGKRGGGDR